MIVNHFEKQPTFEIRPTIEQKPFESKAVQAFFTKWCEINDSIQPQIVTREQWDSLKKEGILKKRPDGKQTLFIPKNLQLWEMVGVMEVIDKDTFTAKPKRSSEAKEKLLALGKTFENAGVYIAKRLGGIGEKEMAEALALELHQYGRSLTEGESQEISRIDDIASHNLTPEETEVIDHFLAGDTLYESRMQRVATLPADNQAKKDESLEAQRQETLSQFFRVAEKAFALESKSANKELQENPIELKPWQSDTPIHNAFLRKIDRALAKQIETPKRELDTAIFRRGLEKLTSEMRERGWKHSINDFFEASGLNLRFEQESLVEALNISQLKTDLEAIREGGDKASISKKEREIADIIQQAVSDLPYKLDANNPSEMVANQYINCVGASMLGGALMKEASLNYLVGDVPEHSILFLVTSDGQVEWRDMRHASFNEDLTDEEIEGRRKDDKPLTVADIVAFSQKPRSEGLMFDIDSPKYREKLSWVKEGQRQYVTVFGPEYGQKIQILNNTGATLCRFGYHEEAVEAYRQAIEVDPKIAYPYNGLGNALRSLDRNEEAVEAYRMFIKLLKDKTGDDYRIKRVEQIIAKLKK